MHYIETISLDFKEAVLFPPMESHGPRAFGVGVIVPTPLKPCHHPSETFLYHIPHHYLLIPSLLPTPPTPLLWIIWYHPIFPVGESSISRRQDIDNYWQRLSRMAIATAYSEAESSLGDSKENISITSTVFNIDGDIIDDDNGSYWL